MYFQKKLKKDLLVQIKMKQKKNQLISKFFKNKVIIFFLFIVVVLFIVKLFFIKPNHLKSEGSVLTIESDESKTKIALIQNSQKEAISNANANHNEPFSRGDFAVWVEESQNKSEKYIVRYHVPTKTTIYITSTGVGQDPRVNTQGQVVWLSWINESWQVFFFDGFQTAQITKDEQSYLNPDIAGTTIVYAQKNENNIWQTIEYSIKTQESKVIKEGIVAKQPYFYGNELFFR